VVAEDPVGMAAYGMDSHNVQRYVDANGYVQNEGNVEAHGFSPYPVSYRSIIPKKGECKNLLDSCLCKFNSHCIRFHPHGTGIYGFGTISSNCSIPWQFKGSDVHSVNYNLLKTRLLNDKQVLSYQPNKFNKLKSKYYEKK
jgi:hypothetical protein